jgi:predicted TIM-barrel enzyme
MDNFLAEMKAAGAAGIQNRPSVGMIDGGFRANLEEAKLGYALEVGMIREAVALDLLTLALVFRPEDARAMAEAGADGVVIHPGVEPRPWGAWADAVAAAAREARRDVLFLAWGAGGDGIDGIQID